MDAVVAARRRGPDLVASLPASPLVSIANSDVTNKRSEVDRTARVWDTRLAMMPLTELLDVICTRMLGALSKLSREEMRFAGYPEITSAIDVCEGSQ